MSKTEKNETEECCEGDSIFTFRAGFRFGLGFVLANILGWTVVAVLVWIILLASRLTGSIL